MQRQIELKKELENTKLVLEAANRGLRVYSYLIDRFYKLVGGGGKDNPIDKCQEIEKKIIELKTLAKSGQEKEE